MCLLSGFVVPEGPILDEGENHRWRRRFCKYLLGRTHVCLSYCEHVERHEVAEYEAYLAGLRCDPGSDSEFLPDIELLVASPLCTQCILKLMSCFTNVQANVSLDGLERCNYSGFVIQAPEVIAVIPKVSALTRESVEEFLKHGESRMKLMMLCNQHDFEFREYLERFGFVGNNSFRQWTVDMYNATRGRPSAQDELDLDVRVTTVMLDFVTSLGYDLLTPYNIPITTECFAIQYELAPEELEQTYELLSEVVEQGIAHVLETSPVIIEYVEDLPVHAEPTQKQDVAQPTTWLSCLSSLFSNRFFLFNFRLCIT